MSKRLLETEKLFDKLSKYNSFLRKYQNGNILIEMEMTKRNEKDT